MVFFIKVKEPNGRGCSLFRFSIIAAQYWIFDITDIDDSYLKCLALL